MSNDNKDNYSEEFDLNDEKDLMEDLWDEPEEESIYETLERLFEKNKYLNFYVTIHSKELDVRRAPLRDIEHDIINDFKVAYGDVDHQKSKVFSNGDLKSVTFNVKKGTYLLDIKSHTR